MLFEIIFTLFLYVISLWIQFRWKMRRIFKELKNMPELKPSLPLIGSAHLLFGKNNEEILNILIKYISLNSPTPIKAWGGPFCLVILDNVDDVVLAMTSPNSQEKHFVYDFFQNKTGLFTAPAKIWKPHRKALNPTFNLKILISFITIFNDCSKVLVKNISKELNVNNIEFDINKYLFPCTLEMVCGSTLGYNINVQNNENMDYLQATIRAAELITERIFRIWLFPDFIYNLSSSCKESKKNFQIAYNLSGNIIKERKEEYLSMSELEKNHIFQTDDDFKKPQIFLHQIFHLAAQGHFSDENIREHVDTIIFAGTETSSLTVSYVILMLAIHQDIQERCYNEINEIFIEENLNYESISKLNYTEMVIKESLRLFPVAPFMGRMSVGDVKIKNYTIPKGVSIIISAYHLHRNKDIWGPDADKFDPDNFLKENIEKRHPGCYLAFSYGQRNCIASRYAMLSMKVIISHLLKNYKFYSTLKLNDLHFKYDLTLKLVNKHLVSIERR